MGEKITCVNGEVLKWSRIQSGELELKTVKDKFETIQLWETGKDYPTYAQLEELSNIYKKPIALFFFPQPPEGFEYKAEFRTMSDAGINLLSYKVVRLVNEALVMQMNLQELVDRPKPPDIILHNLLKKSKDSELIANTRKYLGISVEKQFQTKDAKKMLEIWRDAFNENGIYVFKEAFHDKSISGFCIYDKIFPIIYLNNSMSFTRQIFTLFHELFHLINETGGVDKLRDIKDETLTADQQRIEIMCNQFAGKFLVPEQALLAQIRTESITYDFVSKLAEKFCVSRESMILRLIEQKKVTWDFYNSNIADIDKDLIRQKPKKPGGNANNNLVSYLGNKYLKLAFSAYHSDRIDAFQLASYTKTKVINLSALENAWGGKG